MKSRTMAATVSRSMSRPVRTFSIAHGVGGGRIARLQDLEDHVLLGMMARGGIFLEIVNDCLQHLVIRTLPAIEDAEFLLQDEEELLDVAMLFAQNLDD